jgi:hypothetical protein
MTRIPARIIRRKASDDPTPIPNWMDDSEQVGPCPCGEPFDPDDCIVVEGDAELARWFHEECINWLEYEMTDEELEAKREYEEYRRLMDEDDDE